MIANSLDDNIIVRKNLMLLDNVTNYDKPAIDYFHYNFDSNDLAMPQTWNILCKLGKYKVLRLPSCSSEDDVDYGMYLKRLHHCLWRRWTIEQFRLKNKKIDPLRINWNKEQDVTVLYGPQMSANLHKCPMNSIMAKDPMDIDLVDDLEEQSMIYSSSVESSDSSIFDHYPTRSILKHDTKQKKCKRSLHFNNQVLRRDIDRRGKFHECQVTINDEFPSFTKSASRPLTVRNDCFILGSPSSTDSDNDYDMYYAEHDRLEYLGDKEPVQGRQINHYKDAFML